MVTTRSWRTVPVLLTALALAAFVTGCSKSANPPSSNNSPSGPASTQGGSQSPATSPAAATGEPTYNVFVKNFTYHGMPSTVPANSPFMVSFTNKESFPIQHEFVVLKLTNGKTVQDVVKDAQKKGPKAEDDWTHVGDSGDPLNVDDSTVITMDLAPGNYVATCWQTGKSGGGNGPPHVAIGMHVAFTATTSAPASTTPPAPTYQVDVKNFTYHGMPATVPANQPFHVAFTNKESFPIQHEFVVLKLTNGKTVQDVVKDAQKKGPKAEDDWTHVGDSGDPLNVGDYHVITMDLPPGNYVATCWQTGKAGGGNGPPHVAIGMHAEFTATTSASAPSSTTQGPHYNVYVKNFTYHGMSSTVPANTTFQVGFTNEESFPIQHEFVVLKLTGGKTVQDVVKDAQKKGPKAEDDWIHVGDSGDPLNVGDTTVITMNLPPGKYVATCWQTGKAGGGNGPPHVAIGMHAEFTAS